MRSTHWTGDAKAHLITEEDGQRALDVDLTALEVSRSGGEDTALVVADRQTEEMCSTADGTMTGSRRTGVRQVGRLVESIRCTVAPRAVDQAAARCGTAMTVGAVFSARTTRWSWSTKVSRTRAMRHRVRSSGTARC